MTLKKIISLLWLSFALFMLLWNGVVPGWKDKPADFNNYYVASKMIVEGESIHQFYNNDWFKNQAQRVGIKEGAKFSPFPPITAYVMIPLSIFPPLAAKQIWLVLNCILLMILPFRIKKITDWSLINSGLFLSIFIIPLASNLNFGQIYLVIGFLLTEILGQVYFKNKPKIISLVIGLTALLKYLPVLFLGYIIKYDKRNSILLWFVIIVSLITLGFYQMDNEPYNSFFRDFLSHAKGDLPGQGKYAYGFQSIDSLLNNLFVYDENKNPSPLISLSILKSVIKLMLAMGVLLTIFISFKRANYQVNNIVVSIAIIGAFVLIPASASYHFLLLIWPILSIFKWLVESKLSKELAITTILCFSVLWVQVHHIPTISISPTLNLLAHYPRFWGLLCLFLVLSYLYNKHYLKNHG